MCPKFYFSWDFYSEPDMFKIDNQVLIYKLSLINFLLPIQSWVYLVAQVRRYIE